MKTELMQDLYSKMKFFAYSCKDLDTVEDLFRQRFNNNPKAFLTRSPFGITGKHSNRKKLVLSRKYSGWNCVSVPIILNQTQLEDTIMQLGEVKDLVYVERRKIDNDLKLQQIKSENKNRTYMRYCKYCGKQYYTDVVNPGRHCGAFKCKVRHREYLAYQKEQRKKDAQRHTTATYTKADKMPSLEMDDPAHTTLQGYVYCIRAENGLCKIGRSAKVVERFADIKTISPVPVELEHYVFSDNYVVAESYAHQELAPYRHHGEWFDLPPDIYEWFLQLDNYDLDID